jgi:hypothetical protein
VPVAPEPDPQAGVDSAAAFLRSLSLHELMFATLYAGWPENRPKVQLPTDPGWQLTTWIGSKSPAEEIIATAATWLADLIVMVSEGRTGILDALRGSTMEQVLASAPCPVLIIPAR